MSEENWLQTEQLGRAWNFKKLERLEGFKKLSAWQQKAIRTSLYVEDRTKRQRRVGYNKSRNHKNDWFCHAAVYFIENKENALSRNEEMEEFFGHANYLKNKNPSLHQINQHIIKTGFPCVVVISEMKPDHTPDPAHSFIALGINTDTFGEILIYDKEGYGLPYRITYLKKIYDFSLDHDNEYYWGTRKIEVEENEELEN